MRLKKQKMSVTSALNRIFYFFLRHFSHFLQILNPSLSNNAEHRRCLFFVRGGNDGQKKIIAKFNSSTDDNIILFVRAADV